ncbi:MAG: type II toxin-antitoxin system VapC family toxin [Terrimicrobiaceae bacterium]
MILADTSLWVDHFRRGHPRFEAALQQNRIFTHQVVIGELATGNLGNRKHVLALLRRLPAVKSATADECLAFLESHRLYGRGVGWSDIQLLAAARLSKVMLWTIDKRLAEASRHLGVAFSHAN